MPISKSRLVIGGVALVVLVTTSMLAIFQSSIKGWLYSQAMPADYFSHYYSIEPALYMVSGPVYAFEHGFTRSLVLRTSDGVAVFDTFGDSHSAAMKQAIAQEFPGEAVSWVVFSHNHLDHIRGSSQFAGANVIGHTNVNTLVSDWPEAAKGVLPVTHSIEGNETLTLGDVDVQALYMPFSHSHTLYGFYVPAAGVVFAPDMMFVQQIPPFDFPDFYYPGYIRALDRLIALEAEHYVPSHGWRGNRDDLIAFRNMSVDFQATVKAEFLALAPEAAENGKSMQAALRAVYAKLEPEYGGWHGFEAMFIPKFGRHFGGAYLGY